MSINCSMAKKIESFKKNEATGKSGNYINPINIYITTRYDDAEAVKDYMASIIDDNTLSVDVQRNGDNLYVSLSGDQDTLNAFLDKTYASNYQGFVDACGVDETGWLAPVDLSYYKKNNESLKNEANGDVIYTLRSANCDVYEDSYEEGEGRHVNAFDMDSTVVGKQFSNISDMIAFLGNKVIYDDAYTKGDNWLAFEYEDGELRLDTDVMVDADNNSIGMDYNLDAWKAGKETLYNAHWMVFVSVAYKSDVPSEIVASAVKEAGLECDF